MRRGEDARVFAHLLARTCSLSLPGRGDVRKGHVRKQGEGGHLQARKSSHQKAACSTWVPDQQHPEPEKRNSCCPNHSLGHLVKASRLIQWETLGTQKTQTHLQLPRTGNGKDRERPGHEVNNREKGKVSQRQTSALVTDGPTFYSWVERCTLCKSQIFRIFQISGQYAISK